MKKIIFLLLCFTCFLDCQEISVTFGDSKKPILVNKSVLEESGILKNMLEGSTGESFHWQECYYNIGSKIIELLTLIHDKKEDPEFSKLINEKLESYKLSFKSCLELISRADFLDATILLQVLQKFMTNLVIRSPKFMTKLLISKDERLQKFVIDRTPYTLVNTVQYPNSRNSSPLINPDGSRIIINGCLLKGNGTFVAEERDIWMQGFCIYKRDYYNRLINFFDKDGKIIHTVNNVYSFATSEDGSTKAISFGDGCLKIYKNDQLKFELTGCGVGISSTYLSPDGSTLFIAKPPHIFVYKNGNLFLELTGLFKGCDYDGSTVLISDHDFEHKNFSEYLYKDGKVIKQFNCIGALNHDALRISLDGSLCVTRYKLREMHIFKNGEPSKVVEGVRLYPKFTHDNKILVPNEAGIKKIGRA